MRVADKNDFTLIPNLNDTEEERLLRLEARGTRLITLERTKPSARNSGTKRS